MTQPAVVAYEDRLLSELVHFWNRTFQDRRHFFPLTEDLFRDRVLQAHSPLGRFAAADLLLAVEGEQVVGMVHIGVRSEAVCAHLFGDWPGGPQGYVAILAVDPECRRRGIGSSLMTAARDRFKAWQLSNVVLDGQCINPFYGNSLGPQTPFWGTPEGIGIRWDGQESRRFFSHFGFEVRYRAVSLRTALRSRPALLKSALPPGYAVHRVCNIRPEIGRPLDAAENIARDLESTCHVCTAGNAIAGFLTTYPMRELPGKKHAIYLLEVDEEHRGRKLGNALLRAALTDLESEGAEECEVLTIPSESPAAHHLYLRAGFEEVQDWAIY